MGYRACDPEEAPVSWPIPCEPVELLSPLPTWLLFREEMPRRAGSPRSDAVKWKEIASGAVKKKSGFFSPKIPGKQVFRRAFAGCHDDSAHYLSLKSKFVVTGCNFKKENSLESKKTEYIITEQSGGFSHLRRDQINSLNHLCA